MVSTKIDLVVFLALSASAAFAEELIFRRCCAWVYGKGMLAIMVQGWLLGLLAAWRKSLRPGMLAHWLPDTVNGVVAFLT
jgi:membrane protease YdiL (CAAX protease family)